jgi:hypothetical protein
MRNEVRSSTESRIENLRKKLAALRRAQGGRKSHPSEEIWSEAVELCRKTPLGIVASGIGVSEQGLRNRLKEQSKKARKRSKNAPQKETGRASFMEIAPDALSVARGMAPVLRDVAPQQVRGQIHQLLASPPAPSATSMIELERRDGLKLRLQLSSQSLAHLLSQFMGVAS